MLVKKTACCHVVNAFFFSRLQPVWLISWLNKAKKHAFLAKISASQWVKTNVMCMQPKSGSDCSYISG